MRLVLLPLFNGDIVAIQVAVAGETLHALRYQVSIRHGMTNDDWFLPQLLESVGDEARRLALARPRSNGTDGDDRATTIEHHVVGPEKGKSGSSGDTAAGQVHDMLMRDIGIGEDAGIYTLFADDRLELILVMNRDPPRIESAR